MNIGCVVLIGSTWLEMSKYGFKEEGLEVSGVRLAFAPKRRFAIGFLKVHVIVQAVTHVSTYARAAKHSLPQRTP
jgi:hypothetical protein